MGWGSRLSLDTEAERDRALAELERGFYADASAPAVRARKVHTISTVTLGAGSVPLYRGQLKCLGAALKAGWYRSSSSILSQYKVDAERAGKSCPERC